MEYTPSVASTTSSTNIPMGSTYIGYYGNNVVRVRSNVGTEAGGNAYNPTSSYDEITKE